MLQATPIKENRHSSKQEQRQTRQDILHDGCSSNLWVPYSDCGDRFSKHIIHRDSKSSTHIAKTSTLHPQHPSGPVTPLPSSRTVCICVGEVRVGLTRRKDKGWRRRGKIGREKGVWCEWSVCACVFCFHVVVLVRACLSIRAHGWTRVPSAGMSSREKLYTCSLRKQVPGVPRANLTQP